MLLGPAAAQQAISDGNGTLPGVPAATVSFPTGSASRFSPATVVLVVEVLGLVFIGLVSVASFSVMAQRRLRALGMLSAIGATERNLRLVMIVSGLAVGVAGALAGAVLGLAAWFAYAPTLQQATGHVVDAANLPWWAFALGVVFAVVTSVLASRRPAKTMAPVPVAAALSGRPAAPEAVHRTALPGVFVFAVGVVCLATGGGLAGASGNGARARAAPAGRPGRRDHRHRPARPAGHQHAGRGPAPRLPVAIRIALRDLVRYRARSGAALAASTFAVFVAMGICIVASVQFENALDWTGPSLSSSQVIVYAQPPQGGPPANALTSTPLADVSRHVSRLAASLHARSAVPLESAAATLHQVGAQAHKRLHRHRVRGHPAAARHVRDQGQPDRSRHRHPHHAARAGQPAAHGTDLGKLRPPARPRRPGAQRPRTAELHAERRLPGQPQDADGQQPAQRHLRAEHGDHRVRGEQIPAAGSPVRVADPGTRPAHRHAEQRRAAIRPHLRGDGRDQVGLARPPARSPTAPPRSASSSRSACWPCRSA